MSDHDFEFPWFPFWAKDFVNSRTVRLMPAEQVGVYILLLCHQWMDGPIPDDENSWQLLTGNADATAVERVLNECFEQTEDGWVNARLESVREEQLEKRLQKVRAGKASAKARRKSSDSNKKERRSNGRSTGVQRTYQRNGNESESDTETENNSEAARVTAAVGVFLQKTGAEWALKETIQEWVNRIGREAKYAGVDFRYQILKAADYYAGKGTTHKQPDQALRNWFEKAAERVQPQRRIRTDGAGRSLKHVV